MAEKHYEYNKDLHLVSVEFKQAYDSISRKEIRETMKLLGIWLWGIFKYRQNT